MELLDQIKNGGIIGAGGAGFPTHAKLAGEAEFILMNGAECEPLLRVDQQLMEFMPDEIIQGFNAAGKIVKAKRAIIGIKKKHGRVIEILRERIEALGLGEYIFIGELPDIYPAGDEQVLVHELTGRVVPEADPRLQEAAARRWRPSDELEANGSSLPGAGSERKSGSSRLKTWVRSVMRPVNAS